MQGVCHNKRTDCIPGRMILISACLTGERVRYDGARMAVEDPLLGDWIRDRRVIPVCPEQLGGLPVPRSPAEIVGASASGILSGKGEVRTRSGDDITAAFVTGAQRCLAIARQHGVWLAVFKEKSPSCGRRWIYDGSFSKTLTAGRGVATHLLLAHHIPVYSDRELEKANRFLLHGA
jgi:uncharacterized protein YbbK (DUF523 family)